MAESTANFDEVITNAVNLAQKSIETYADLAKRAAKRLEHPEAKDTGSWADDLVTAWAAIARDASNAMFSATGWLQAASAATPGPAEPAAEATKAPETKKKAAGPKKKASGAKKKANG